MELLWKKTKTIHNSVDDLLQSFINPVKVTYIQNILYNDSEKTRQSYIDYITTEATLKNEKNLLFYLNYFDWFTKVPTELRTRLSVLVKPVISSTNVAQTFKQLCLTKKQTRIIPQNEKETLRWLTLYPYDNGNSDAGKRNWASVSRRQTNFTKVMKDLMYVIKQRVVCKDTQLTKEEL